MVSSSCSYAASALAKSLFVRGADFTAAQAFMFASTNLVVELGIVLWLLIGWQFAVARVRRWRHHDRPAHLAAATGRVPAGRRGCAGAAAPARTTHGGHEGHGAGGDPATSWRQRARTRAGWSDASGYTISDLTMVRRELVLGFIVAGFATVMVPTSVWQAVFVTGHGFWSSLENAVVGPFIAIISFVCSVGNVPLAAALWQGGISFGGVMAFLFADLIALPLLFIYRKYYGTPLMLRLLAAFWVTMSTAGLTTEYLFRWLGWLPTTRPETIASGHVGWNYTTVLNIVALIGLAGSCTGSTAPRRSRGERYAKDPICGMQVEVAHAPATVGPRRDHALLLLRPLRAPVLRADRGGALAGLRSAAAVQPVAAARTGRPSPRPVRARRLR